MFSFSLNNLFFTIICSLLIITAGHFLWNHLRDTYTTKKTKNLIHGQIEKYQKIIEQIQEHTTTNDEFLNEKERFDMNEDLTAFANGL